MNKKMYYIVRNCNNDVVGVFNSKDLAIEYAKGVANLLTHSFTLSEYDDDIGKYDDSYGYWGAIYLTPLSERPLSKTREVVVDGIFMNEGF